MPIEPFAIRVQRPDGSPVAGIEVLVAPVSAPLQPRRRGVVVEDTVTLTTDMTGLAQADLVTGQMTVRVGDAPTVTVDHKGGPVPSLLPAVTVSGTLRKLNGAASEKPVTFHPQFESLVEGVLVMPEVVTVEPENGTITLRLIPGQYVARSSGGRPGLVDVPGDWLMESFGVPASWGGSRATWGGAPLTWGIAA